MHIYYALLGVVTREAPKSPIKSQDRVEGGVITYDHGDVKKTIMYFLKDCEKPPRIGDRVRFDIYLVSSFEININSALINIFWLTMLFECERLS